MTGKQKKGTTAAEFMQQLAVDANYQAMIAEKSAKVEEKAAALREAERPIIADLAAVGIRVSSVWDVVNMSTPYPQALPVLLDHLRRGGYPDRSAEGMGRALAVKPSVEFWPQLRRLYLRATGSGEQEGLAVALAASATTSQVDDLMALVGDDSRTGDSRIHFLRPIRKLGGEVGVAFVESLVDDSSFGREASAISRRRN